VRYPHPRPFATLSSGSFAGKGSEACENAGDKKKKENENKNEKKERIKKIEKRIEKT